MQCIADEVLEIVDEEDRVVGTERRHIIHQRGLMHRSAQVLLFNSEGQVFLQKRSMNKDEFPGLWDSSAAGHVNPGESYHQCAKRELCEELGIQCSGSLIQLFKFPASKSTGWEHGTVFRYISDCSLTLQPGEVDEGRWLSPDEMDTWVADVRSPLTPAIRSIWKKFRKLSG
jgi:isopentenyl-diphosphate delta-isomerase type 1